MRVAKDINSLRYRRFILKSDQEPAIVALKEAIRVQMNEDEVIMEESPVRESQSNGDIEKGVGDVKGQIRTMKEALDTRSKDIIRQDHQVIAWLPRHAAATLVRYSAGQDGRTPYQRWKGQAFKKEVA